MGDRYQHLQLYNDFIHIKMYHIDTHRFRDDIDDEDSKEKNDDIGYQLFSRFSERYPCAHLSKCRGFTRHYRPRGRGDEEDSLFHLIGDKSLESKTVQILNTKERILQEECDKIHTYFLHSTIQFRRRGSDQSSRRIVDEIAANAQGRSYSKRQETDTSIMQENPIAKTDNLYLGQNGIFCGVYSEFRYVLADMCRG